MNAVLGACLAFALAFSGSAAQLHALSHAQRDLQVASHDHIPPSPLQHESDRCLVFHAFDGMATEVRSPANPDSVPHEDPPKVAVLGGETPAAWFYSRAPPVCS